MDYVSIKLSSNIYTRNIISQSFYFIENVSNKLYQNKLEINLACILQYFRTADILTSTI